MIDFDDQNETVVQDIGRGVLISGNSLVLQSVTRDQAGDYSCHASNLEGDTTSSIIKIEIRCKNSFCIIHCNNISPTTLQHQIRGKINRNSWRLSVDREGNPVKLFFVLTSLHGDSIIFLYPS